MSKWSTRRPLKSLERQKLAAVGRRYNKGLALMRQARAEIDELLISYDGVVTQHELADAMDVDRNVVREAKSRLRARTNARS